MPPNLLTQQKQSTNGVYPTRTSILSAHLENRVKAADTVIDLIQETVMAFNTAIEEQSVCHKITTDAEKRLKEAEAEIIYHATIQAKNKEGPLSGIATSSKAYDIALKHLIATAHTNQLAQVYQSYQDAQQSSQQVEVIIAKLSNQFRSLRYLAELQGSILDVYATSHSL